MLGAAIVVGKGRRDEEGQVSCEAESLGRLVFELKCNMQV